MQALYVFLALFVAVTLGSTAAPTSAPVPVASTNITAVAADGFDIILLDSPSWVTKIQRSYGNHEFFVFGETTLRTINSGFDTPDFYAVPVTDPWNFPLIDLHTYFVNNTMLTFGVTDYTPDNGNRMNGVSGPYIPMFSAWSTVGSGLPSVQKIQAPNTATIPADFDGFLSYALRVDDRNASNGDYVTYFAGFVIGDAATVNFTLTKTHYNPNPNQMDPRYNNFWYNPSDCFTLYQNMFTAFSDTYKPWVHYIPYFGNLNHTFVVVVDPNTRAVYGVDVDAGSAAAVATYTFPSATFAGTEVVSTTFDITTNTLFVGFAASGFAPGYVSVFSFQSSANYVIPNPVTITLPQNYSNPKAMTSDGTNLYICFNGMSETIAIALMNNSIVGYQRLPEFLHRAWDGTNTPGHVYFVTYEQNSKVFRVAKTDYCSSPCPYNGFCTGGACVCADGYEFTNEKTQCSLTAAREIITIQHHYIKAKGGEAALGVLFALSFVAAAIGWFLWYRNQRRGNHYQSV